MALLVRGEDFNFRLVSRSTEIVDQISYAMKRDLQPVVLDQAKLELRSQSLSSAKAPWYRNYLT